MYLFTWELFWCKRTWTSRLFSWQCSNGGWQIKGLTWHTHRHKRPHLSGRHLHVQDTAIVKNMEHVNLDHHSSHRRQQHIKEMITESTQNRHHKPPYADKLLRLGSEHLWSCLPCDYDILSQLITHHFSHTDSYAWKIVNHTLCMA